MARTKIWLLVAIVVAVSVASSVRILRSDHPRPDSPCTIPFETHLGGVSIVHAYIPCDLI